jgi:HK97 family phage major capsid protein
MGYVYAPMAAGVPGCARNAFNPAGLRQSGRPVEPRQLGVCDFGCRAAKAEFHPKESDMNLQEMKQAQKEALDTANAMVTAAERANRGLSASELENYNNAMSKYKELGVTVKAREEQNSILGMFPGGRVVTDHRPNPNATGLSWPVMSAETRSPDYMNALFGHIRTEGKVRADALTAGLDPFGGGGYYLPGSERYTQQRNANGSYAPRMRADMYEGSPDGSSGAAGGFMVDVVTNQVPVPLGLPDLGIFDCSLVIPTSTAIKIPSQSAFGGSAIKAESGSSVVSFAETDPTLASVELDAYMVGNYRTASWELLQDVQTFQQFLVSDLINSQRIFEGQLLATGTGSSQPLGVFGNTGTGTGTATELTGTAATDAPLLIGSLYEVMATLKGVYQPGAVWVMNRITGLAIRQAQMQANLFNPVVTVDPDGTERILGKPVFYDVNAPALPTATTAGVTPVLYGDFKQGNIIGVRGGSGINIKILDQPAALQGNLIILAYRRIDSRIRRSEAMQQILISHS